MTLTNIYCRDPRKRQHRNHHPPTIRQRLQHKRPLPPPPVLLSRPAPDKNEGQHRERLQRGGAPLLPRRPPVLHVEVRGGPVHAVRGPGARPQAGQGEQRQPGGDRDRDTQAGRDVGGGVRAVSEKVRGDPRSGEGGGGGRGRQDDRVFGQRGCELYHGGYCAR